MNFNQIAYKSGYKYQLKLDYIVAIEIKPVSAIKTDYIILTKDGELTIKAGYAWDGPSGISIDTSNFMRGSLVHDALYQLMREGHIDRFVWHNIANKILRRICEEDGMSKIRALWVYEAVNMFGDPYTDPAKDNPILIAP